MIRVGLVTTWGEVRCGVAEYSRMLMENIVDPEVQVTPIGGPYHVEALLPRVLVGQYDVVHVMFDAGYVGIFAPGVAQRFRAGGAKLLMTLCDHHARNNRALFAFTAEFDRVVVHVETNEGFEYIPIGIDVLENSPWSARNVGIGTCGFPLPQKGILLVPQAAAILGMPCTMVCAASQHIDTHAIGRQVKAIWPHTNYITDWLPQREVQKIMAGNLVNVFPMRDGKSGISASVRMGIATGSYMVMSRSWMFADLWGDERYADEIEWIPGEANEVTPQAVADAVRRVIDNGKRPNQILEDMVWKKSAAKYVKMYRSLVGKTVAA